jgi:hypothetical protein
MEHDRNYGTGSKAMLDRPQDGHEPPLGDLMHAHLEQLEHALTRMQAMHDRVYGPQPETPNSAATEAGRQPLCQQVARANNLSHLLHGLIGRLERAL